MIIDGYTAELLINRAIGGTTLEESVKALQDVFVDHDPAEKGESMSDLIDRQAAIRETWREPTYFDPLNVMTEMRDRLKALPSAEPEPELDEWCTDCKEYDQERHCCPRWNRVIRQTLKDVENKIVRCEDCKYNDGGRPSADGRYLCVLHGSFMHYCSDAERKEDV